MQLTGKSLLGCSVSGPPWFDNTPVGTRDSAHGKRVAPQTVKSGPRQKSPFPPGKLAVLTCRHHHPFTARDMINHRIHPIPIHITAHNVTLSPALCEFVRQKIGAVARFSNDVLSIEIVLRRAPATGSERFSASARIALPGHDIHSRAAASDLYVAVGKVATRLARRSRKRKTRLSKRFDVRSKIRSTKAGTDPLAIHRRSQGFSATVGIRP